MERKWWTLVAVCIATFMLLLDITIVNVALPAIERALKVYSSIRFKLQVPRFTFMSQIQLET